MAETVYLRGYRECLRALGRIDKDLAKVIRAELRRLAEPIAADAREKETRWQGASIQTIGPKVSQRGVYVTQRARKVTGLRPDYGSLQMRDAFIPALEDHANEIEPGVLHAYDALVAAAGFH